MNQTANRFPKTHYIRAALKSFDDPDGADANGVLKRAVLLAKQQGEKLVATTQEVYAERYRLRKAINTNRLTPVLIEKYETTSRQIPSTNGHTNGHANGKAIETPKATSPVATDDSFCLGEIRTVRDALKTVGGKDRFLKVVAFLEALSV